MPNIEQPILIECKDPGVVRLVGSFPPAIDIEDLQEFARAIVDVQNVKAAFPQIREVTGTFYFPV